MGWLDSKAKQVGGTVADGAKAVGGVVGVYNPLKKGPTYSGPDVKESAPVTAPTMGATQGPAQVQGAPTAFTGGQIAPVQDPRQVLIDTAGQDQVRQQQQALIGQLAQQASGVGPSVASTQLQQAQQANQAATFAQLASARGGGNPALARQAMVTSGNVQAQTARDAAVARMQEQQAAQGLLANTLGGVRTQDQALAGQQAQLEQEANLAAYRGQLETAVAQGQLDQRTAEAMFAEANQNVRLNATNAQQANMQYNDLVQRYAAMGLDAQRANQLAAMDYQKMLQDQAYRKYQSEADAAAAQKKAIGNTIGAVAQMGAGYATGGGLTGALKAGATGGASLATPAAPAAPAAPGG